MKVFFGVLLILISCGISRENFKSDNSVLPIENKTDLIKIELSGNEISAFGLPLNFQYGTTELLYCLEKTDSVKDTIRNVGYLDMNRERNKIFFTYKEGSKLIKGQFFIPDYQEIIYQKEYDAATLIPRILLPIKVHNVVRTGEWIYDKDGKKFKKNYLIVIEDFSKVCD